MSRRTQILSVDPEKPAGQAVARAAALLRGGGLVAFPTETVYGLGAKALDPAAVAGIFAAKGRPATNPLIVHTASPEQALALARHFPPTAEQLATRFWPGPLTLVLPRRSVVPSVVTAGGDTVALRVPAHPVALALLRAVDQPLAAPSANRSQRLSPTTAEHVRQDLDGLIDLILDAGPTSGGLESTVLDLTVLPPRILRPGLVSPAEIEAVIGPVLRPDPSPLPGDKPLRSPGLLGRHYAPRAVLECVSGDSSARVRELAAAGARVGWLTWEVSSPLPENVLAVTMPRQARDYAARLYAMLHHLDAAGVERIVVSLPPETEEWLAVRDRLQRASAS